MAILRIKDNNGNVYPIPAIQGEPGKDYVLTDKDKQDIANLIGGGSGGGATKRPTESVETFDFVAVETFNKNDALYVTDSNIPVGVEVADVEFFYNEEWVSIKHLTNYDDEPYFFSMGKTRSNGDGTFVASIGYASNIKGRVLQALLDYEISSIRITYYTD